MSNYSRLIAGDNISIEKKAGSTVIHCISKQSPQENLHSGYFQFKIEPEENSRLRAVISNCVFRLNGKYVKINDYIIDTYYAEQNMIYLKLHENPLQCSFYHEVYHSDEVPTEYLDRSDLILLYKLNVRNARMHVETFAAGGLIDTIFGNEGFLFCLKDGSIQSTLTLSGGTEENEFSSRNDRIYIPSFDPVTGKGINIACPRNRGGALAIGKEENFYNWQCTGWPGSWGETITVKINPERIYI